MLLQDWVKELRTISATIPDSTLKTALREAAIDFCRRSKTWRYDHPDILLVACIGQYELDLPDDSMIEEFQCPPQNANGQPVYEKSYGYFNTEVPNWESATGYCPINFATDYTSRLDIVPVPRETSNDQWLKNVKLILVPTQDSQEIPDFLYGEHRQALIFGVKYLLYQQDQKPWANGGLAQSMRMLFDEAIDRAYARVNPGETGRRLQMTLPRGYTRPSKSGRGID